VSSLQKGRGAHPPPATGETLTTASPHLAALAELGLAEPAVSRLARYLDTLATWSPRVNLTGARTAPERVRLLVGDILPALPLVVSGRLLDVGSGNGSPGLVLALLREDLEVTLLEPRQKRWAFLREAARAAGVPTVQVLRARHDEYEGPPARTLTLRALCLPLPQLGRLVEPAGRLIVFGVRPEPQAPFVLESGMPESGTPEGLHVFRREDVPRET
jgi:16S rRNA (guanine(527)-N(7))-methyltransferase RsmG